MRGERDTDPEALMARYGMGRRLATRLVALLARRVDVTPTVLALASAGSPAERLLLRPELLRQDEGLSEAALKALAAECGLEEADLLRLVPASEQGWRTIALEDDVLAEVARIEQGATAEMEPLSLVRLTPAQVGVSGAAELFAPEEVARLKLSVLTSQEPDQRTESIRKLVFAPMDGGQKVAILLNVLVDREAGAKVRREAIRALEQIGLRSDMADAVRSLFAEDTAEALLGAQRLAALLGEAKPAEAALILAVVLELLDQSRDAALVVELLRLVGKHAALLMASYQNAEKFLQAAMRHAARDLDAVRIDLERAMLSCAQQAPELTCELLWAELGRTQNPRVRALLLGLCESLAAARDRIDQLASLAVAEVLNPLLPEADKARLRYGLVRVGEPAVLVALERLAGATTAERAELVRLLDVLCTESQVSDQTLQRAVGALVDLLKLADQPTRRLVLQTALLVDRRVPTAAQGEVAQEVLALMAELGLPDSLDSAQYVLERLGLPAAEPAFEFFCRSYPSTAGQRAAIALGNIMQSWPGQLDDALAEKIISTCTQWLCEERFEEGAFVVTLGSACGYTRCGIHHFGAVFDRLRQSVWRLPYFTDVLDALGIMGGSPNAQPQHQQALFELFDGITCYQPRKGIGRRVETEEGTVYEFGREIEFDVRVVPCAVRGLERLCVSTQAAPSLRIEIAKRFLVLWEGVTKARIIWGPAAVEALIRAMCNAACCPQATSLMRVRLGVSLLRSLNRISVVRSIGQICAQPEEAAQMREFAMQAAAELLNEWDACDVQDLERRFALLESAGRIAARHDLPADSEVVRHLRQRTLDALFRGLREGMEEVRKPLLLLRDCPGLSSRQKQEIDERLGKVFGLVRTCRQQ